MSETTTNEQTSMSKIIKEAVRKTVEQTQEAVRLAEKKELGKDPATIMLNGAETKINRPDYELLKQKNREIQLQMKKQLRDFISIKK